MTRRHGTASVLARLGGRHPILFGVFVYLNGRLVPAEDAQISVFDRGFLFGDGVYEGLRAFGGRVHSVQRHEQRLREGLEATGIPADADGLERICLSLIEANGLTDAFVYLQYTRGVPGSGHRPRMRVPDGPLEPTVFGLSMEQPPIDQYAHVPTMTACTSDDCRWSLGRVKSISLLGNVLAALEADRRGAREAIMTRDGVITEATACNVILVLREGGRDRLVTPSLDSAPILAGVTRAKVLELDPEIEEVEAPAEWLDRATEIILVGTTALVSACTHLDGRAIGTGGAGPHARRLLGLYVESIRSELALEAATL